MNLKEEKMKEIRTDVIDRLEKAKIEIILSYPFFSSFVLSIPQVFDYDVPTARIDFKPLTIRLNPIFVSLMRSKRDLMNVIMHEILHLILMHFRIPAAYSKPPLTNIAQDLAVNSLLKSIGFKSPDIPGISWIEPAMFGFPEGLSWEEYYKLLEKSISFSNSSNSKKTSDSSADSSSGNSEGAIKKENFEGTIGKVKIKGIPEGYEIEKDDLSGKNPDVHNSSEQLSEGEKAKLEEELKKQIAEAFAYSKLCGKIPAGLVEIIENILHPKLNWRQILGDFLTKIARRRINWLFPNKKLLLEGVYIPTLRNKKLDIVIAVDTSGSMSRDELVKVFSEINGILKYFNDYSIELIEADAKIAKITKIEYPDKLEGEKIKIHGRGGTDYNEVFDYINSTRLRPLIYFTDLAIDQFPPIEKVKFPVLWICTDRKATPAPYGWTIYLD